MLYVAFDDAARAELQSRARWQRAAGGDVEELSPRQAFKLAPVLSEKIIFALHMPNNRRVENRKLTLAYINAATHAGADFREGARVDSIAITAARATGLRLADGSLETGDVIINAAGSWAGDIRGLEDDRIRFYPVRGQILCFDARPGLVVPSLFSGGGILVPRRDGRLLAGSVFEDAGFNKSVTLDGMERIAARGACDGSLDRLDSLSRSMGWTSPRHRRLAAGARSVADGRRRALRRRTFPQRHSALRADR